MDRKRITTLVLLSAILFSVCYANFVIEQVHYVPPSEMIDNAENYEGKEVWVHGTALDVQNQGDHITYEVLYEDMIFYVRQGLNIPEEFPGAGDKVHVRGVFTWQHLDRPSLLV